MRGKFAAEQFGIAAGEQHMHSLAQHTVYEKMPPFDVLNLVKKKVGEVAVYAIENLEDVVHVLDGKAVQVLIV